jgi:hypothetical protein
MIRIISIAGILSFLSTIALATEPPPRYTTPTPGADPQSTIVAGFLMIVNGLIMQEADRRGQDCATYVTGLHRNGFPIFKEACRMPQATGPQ